MIDTFIKSFTVQFCVLVIALYGNVLYGAALYDAVMQSTLLQCMPPKTIYYGCLF